MALPMLKSRVAALQASALRTAALPRIGATTRQRGSTWMRRRGQWLRAHPMCAECERRGKVVLATELDHIQPLADGGADDDSNMQGLCVPCHKRKTAREARVRQG